MIVRKNQLTNEELQMVRDLAALCAAHDGAAPIFYPNILLQKRSTESNILYFENNSLIGFISIYFFYADACEITLMVAPGNRRNGIAKKLLSKALPIFFSRQVERLIFSTAMILDTKWFKDLGLTYKSSEYTMEKITTEPIVIKNPKLSIVKATEKDIPILDFIDSVSFKNKSANMISRLKNLLNEPNYTILTASYNDKIVGAVHLCFENKNVLLSDLAIIPNLQGHGLGGELLSYCINLALSKEVTKITLHVEDPKVINFYLHYGFQVTLINEYWIIELPQFIENFLAGPKQSKPIM